MFENAHSLLNFDHSTSVQEDRHKATLEKETSARIKVEKDFEEKCKDLQTTLEDKKLTQQQLAELQLLTKKVSHD